MKAAVEGVLVGVSAFADGPECVDVVEARGAGAASTHCRVRTSGSAPCTDRSAAPGRASSRSWDRSRNTTFTGALERA